ncbi:DUF262 domain-containing protein [Tissierella creatinini]|nr:DUF262 domain-containing protein [Tissierella creatinini]TJX59255.1 DUF262 domain-containing protein [Soehngenia saccharolytica]
MVIEENLLFDEAGEETENELKVDLSKFSQAVIWGTDWTTETIVLQLEKGNIDLNPTFQRRDAWTDQEKSKLIESLILGIPVPPIILAESKEKKNSYIVIDGKQRLLSLRRFFSKISQKEFEEKSLNEKNVFRQLKLSGLEILKNLNGCSYDDVEKEDEEYITNLENQSIRTIVIKNWPDESFLYTVFLRLNTGSKKLSPQELRQALKPGKFLTYLDDATADSDSIKRMLNNKSADPRMKDIEMALRYYAFKYFIEEYNGNLKNFLDTTCERLNNSWDNDSDEIISEFKELENAIEFSYEVMSEKSPFSRHTNGISNNRFNRSIFELFSYYFSEENIRQLVSENPDEFKSKFILLNDNPEFVSAITDTTKETSRVVTRFSLFVDLLISLNSSHKYNFTIHKFELCDRKICIRNVGL